MLNKEEAKEVDEIIKILRVYKTAEFFYAYSEVTEQLSKQGNSPTGGDIIPNLEMLSIVDRQLGHSILKTGLTVMLFKHLKKNELIIGEKMGLDAPILLTNHGKKIEAFVKAAHKTEWLRYFLQFHRRTEKWTTFFYTTRILLFIKRFTQENGFPPQSIISIVNDLKAAHGPIYLNLYLLEGEKFIQFIEGTQPYVSAKRMLGRESLRTKPKAVQITARGEQLLEEMEKAYRAYQKA